MLAWETDLGFAQARIAQLEQENERLRALLKEVWLDTDGGNLFMSHVMKIEVAKELEK